MTCRCCRGIGCSSCQRPYTLGRITFNPAPSSLSELVGKIAEGRHTPTDTEWKQQAFAAPGWDANGSEVM